MRPPWPWPQLPFSIWIWTLPSLPWRRKWHPTLVFLPGESQEQRSLVGYSPWCHKELDTTEWLTHSLPHFILFLLYPATNLYTPDYFWIFFFLWTDFQVSRGLMCLSTPPAGLSLFILPTSPPPLPHLFHLWTVWNQAWASSLSIW